MQSKAVDGFHSEEQQVLQAPQTQVPQVQQTQQTTQPQQVLLPPAPQGQDCSENKTEPKKKKRPKADQKIHVYLNQSNPICLNLQV